MGWGGGGVILWYFSCPHSCPYTTPQLPLHYPTAAPTLPHSCPYTTPHCPYTTPQLPLKALPHSCPYTTPQLPLHYPTAAPTLPHSCPYTTSQLPLRFVPMVTHHPATHWVPFSDHSMESDDVWVCKLSHDGCLSQEPHPVIRGGVQVESLDGHLQGVATMLPHPLLDGTKLSRS